MRNPTPPCSDYTDLSDCDKIDTVWARAQNFKIEKTCGPQFATAGLERAKGIEPSCSAWEADVLPLNYARNSTVLFILIQTG